MTEQETLKYLFQILTLSPEAVIINVASELNPTVLKMDSVLVGLPNVTF